MGEGEEVEPMVMAHVGTASARAKGRARSVAVFNTGISEGKG